MAAPGAPDRYDVQHLRDGYAIVEIYNGGFGREIIERCFECEAAAWDRIDEHIQNDRDEAEALALAVAEFDAEDLRRAA